MSFFEKLCCCVSIKIGGIIVALWYIFGYGSMLGRAGMKVSDAFEDDVPNEVVGGGYKAARIFLLIF